MKTALYTSLALFAFACNSILCRIALGDNLIDASSFTSIRLLSGALVLVVILTMTQKTKTNVSSVSGVGWKKGSWKAALMLFVYATTFSFAYISLETGTGALILFASVQITMILTGLFYGTRLNYIEWFGVAIAFVGFVYLVLPGLETPSLYGFILMSLSGVAWGAYTLEGKQSKDALLDTTYNFLRTLPLVIALTGITAGFVVWSGLSMLALSGKGIALAVLSGGLASGVGYTIWYMALRELSSIQAAVLQLLVPVIAALGGIVFVGETISIHFLVSSLMILGGILAVILGKRSPVLLNKLK